MTDAELAEERRLAHDRVAAGGPDAVVPTSERSGALVTALAWAAVGLPIAWGIYKTLINASKFFG
jgi:hypothetical protein